jgi:hypothetical protein
LEESEVDAPASTFVKLLHVRGILACGGLDMNYLDERDESRSCGDDESVG